MKQRTGKECKKTNCKNYKYYSNWGKSMAYNGRALEECMNCRNSFVSQYKSKEEVNDRQR